MLRIITSLREWEGIMACANIYVLCAHQIILDIVQSLSCI
jgi:hypothetical protein